MALRHLTGDPGRYNFFAWGVRTSSSEDSKYPLSNIGDGDPGRPFKFNDAGADRHATVDAVMTVNGALDTWTVPANGPDGYTKVISGTGSVTQDSVIFAGAGGSSARLNAGASGTAAIRQLLTVRAGQRVQLEVKIRKASAGSHAGRVFVQNLRTGKYLHPTDGWVVGSVAYLTHNTNTGAFQLVGGGIGSPNGQFQVEGFLAVEADTSLLQVTLDVDPAASGDIWFDDFFVFPACNFCAVHGHNLEPGLPLLARSGFDGSLFTTRATMTPRAPSFYAIFSEVYERYFRVQYSGTPSAAAGAVWYGEVVFGQIETNLRAQMYGWQTRYLFDQIRNANDVGHVQAFRRAVLERRALKLSFDPKSETHFDQLRDEWARRSFGGLYPMVVVPDDSNASLVLQGRMTEELAVLREFTVWPTDVVVAENGFPVVTT